MEKERERGRGRGRGRDGSLELFFSFFEKVMEKMDAVYNRYRGNTVKSNKDTETETEKQRQKQTHKDPK
jgi:hypothetical protein